MHVPSPDPLLELLEGFTCAGIKCCLGISTTILLHRPSVIVAEVKEIPEFGVPASRLKDVTIVDLGVSKHRRDHVFQALVVALGLVHSKHVHDSVTIIILVVGVGKSVKKDDIKSDFRLIIANFVKTSLNGCHSVETHCSAAIDVDSTLVYLRLEEEWQAC